MNIKRYITGRFESGFVVENAREFSSEKNNANRSIFGHFFKKTHARKETKRET